MLYHLSLSLSLSLSLEKEHEDAVKKHCNHLMEFQGKMSEACMKFESLEEEHLAQMVTFMGKITQVCWVLGVGKGSSNQ